MFWQVMPAHTQQNVGARQRAEVCPFLLSPVFGAAVPLPPLLCSVLFSGSAFLAHMAEPKPHHLPSSIAHRNFLTFIHNETFVPFAKAWLDLVGFWPPHGTSGALRPLSLVAKPSTQTRPALLPVYHSPAPILFAPFSCHCVLKKTFTFLYGD